MARKPLVFELTDEAAEAIQQCGKITKRDLDGVIADALTVYIWILHQQMAGGKIVSINDDSDGETELANMIADKKKAESYFASKLTGAEQG